MVSKGSKFKILRNKENLSGGRDKANPFNFLDNIYFIILLSANRVCKPGMSCKITEKQSFF